MGVKELEKKKKSKYKWDRKTKKRGKGPISRRHVDGEGIGGKGTEIWSASKAGNRK